MPAHSTTELSRIYQARFAGRAEYRRRVWEILCSFFSKWIPQDTVVLDLGCGHCEFINAVQAHRKYAMDLNPDSVELAAPGVSVLKQDCAEDWGLAPDTLDVVFTSNFFEHLPDKPALQRTLQNAKRSIRPGGVLVMMGPNIRYLRGAYWDFFDHYIPLTELSLVEVLKTIGFEIDVCISRFLPYTMSQGQSYPTWMLKVYLALPWVWRVFGKQFLVVARKPAYRHD